MHRRRGGVGVGVGVGVLPCHSVVSFGKKLQLTSSLSTIPSRFSRTLAGFARTVAPLIEETTNQTKSLKMK